MIVNLIIGLYLVCTILIVLFVSSYGVLLVIYLFTRNKAPALPPINDLLSVTIQLPIYNEAHVAARLIDACARLDYPPNKLHIQILDDSTDETTDIIRTKVAELRTRGFMSITHLHRKNRHGFKAGALARGLREVTTDCIAVFDADFVPKPDFLQRTMPHFQANPKLALIQTRWSHLNWNANWLTRAQALNIDSHFVIEQVARSRGKLPMSMNGTGGIWRVQAIHDAGGWSASTLTEDLDLSYRAYMRGWDFLYLMDVDVPGELPPSVQAYKTQQARWATGSTQCLIYHASALIRHPHLTLLQKVMGLIHLAQYVIQPIILLVFLLTPLMLWGNAFKYLPNLTLLASVGIIPPLMIGLSQVELYKNPWQRLWAFPLQFITAVAIVLSNTKAVFRAFSKTKHVFQRTPKYANTNWTKSHYHLPIDLTILGEIGLAIYALFGLIESLQTLPTFAPYMLSYAISFASFAGLNLYQTWRYTNK
ncbi:MAG: glycosyltransferase family 2 protein [Phototrophicales bacterium]